MCGFLDTKLWLQTIPQMVKWWSTVDSDPFPRTSSNFFSNLSLLLEMISPIQPSVWLNPFSSTIFYLLLSPQLWEQNIHVI